MKTTLLASIIGLFFLDNRSATTASAWFSQGPVRYPVCVTNSVRPLPDPVDSTALSADSLFRFLRRMDNCIPWDFPEDYCFARAHASYLLVKEHFGMQLGKMYIYPADPTSELKLKLKLPSQALYDSARWNGHVTTFVVLKQDTLIIDPALTDGPVRKADYLNLLHVPLQDFTIDYGDGGDYCTTCQDKYNYHGQEALAVTRRAINESRQRRAQYLKETEIERSYKTCTNFLPPN